MKIPIKKIATFLALLFMISLAHPWTVERVYLFSQGHAFQIEAPFIDINFRDLGQSINQCAGQNILPEGRVFRSSRFFSGWSCERIGSPDELVTLNYEPKKRESYYCFDDLQVKVGHVFHEGEELNDLEFEKTWDLEKQRRPFCKAWKYIKSSIDQGKSVTVHCDAGRDRTGAMSALIAGTLLEKSALLSTSQILEIVECDYQKTLSLAPDKKGRMAHFLEFVSRRGKGSLIQGIENLCI